MGFSLGGALGGGLLGGPAGALAGGFLGGGGGLFGTSKGNTTSTTTSQPWSEVQPYMKDIFKLGQGLYNQNYVSPYTTQAQTLTANRALNGSPLMQSGNNLLGQTISGQFLDPYSNPYFSGALNRTLGDVKSQINSNFRGDNFGSSAHQEWLGRGLSDAALPMLANQYNQERSNQNAALGLLPTYANQDYTDLNALSGVGAQQEASPWNNLFRYQQAISGFGNTGGTTTTTNPYYVNNTANTLGAVTNLGMAGKLFGLF